MAKKKMRHTCNKRLQSQKPAPSNYFPENASGAPILAELWKELSDLDEKLYQSLRREVLEIIQDLNEELASMDSDELPKLDENSTSIGK